MEKSVIKASAANIAIGGCLVILVPICIWSLAFPLGFEGFIDSMCQMLPVCIPKGFYGDRSTLVAAGFSTYAPGFASLRRIFCIVTTIQLAIMMIVKYASGNGVVESQVVRLKSRKYFWPIVLLTIAILLYMLLIRRDFYGSNFHYSVFGPPAGTFVLCLGSTILSLALTVAFSELININIFRGDRR